MGAPASSNMHGSGIIPELLEAKCATHDPHALSTDMHHPPHFHISGPLKQEAGAVEGQCASNDSVVVCCPFRLWHVSSHLHLKFVVSFTGGAETGNSGAS